MTPVSRLALLLGRVLRDVLVLLVQSVLLVAVAFAFGLRAPLPGILLGLAFVVLLAVSLSSLSYAAGLLTKSEDVFAPLVSMISLPLMLLSGILLPMSLAPDWLNALAHLNPFLYVVEAMHAAFLGEYASFVVPEGVVVGLAPHADTLPGLLPDVDACPIHRCELAHEMSREPDAELLDLPDRLASEREYGVLLRVRRHDLAVVAGEMGFGEVPRQRHTYGQIPHLVQRAGLGDAHHVRLGLAVLVVPEKDRHVPLYVV